MIRKTILILFLILIFAQIGVCEENNTTNVAGNSGFGYQEIASGWKDITGILFVAIIVGILFLVLKMITDELDMQDAISWFLYAGGGLIVIAIITWVITIFPH